MTSEAEVTIRGTLIAESLKIGSTLEGIPLVMQRLSRVAPGNTSSDQPSHWTLIEFEADDRYIDSLASMLADALDEPGWYADLRSIAETVVIFPGQVFRYARGDESERARAEAYGRSLGIPESQLDCSE
jgi:hypothetical protein